MRVERDELPADHPLGVDLYRKLSIRAAAAYLELDESTVRDKIHGGLILASKPGRDFRITVRELLRFEESTTNRAKVVAAAAGRVQGDSEVRRGAIEMGVAGEPDSVVQDILASTR